MKKKLSPEEYRRKWGIPNWRDEKSYPLILTDTLWRWEFLRRLDDYRADWSRSFPSTIKWYRKHSPRDSFNMKAPHDGRVFPDNFGNGPESPRFRAHMKEALAKYHLTGLSNPAIQQPKNIDFRGKIEIPICFDLSLKIEELMECAKNVFKMLKPAFELDKRRKRRSEWRVYLRALDAEAEKVTYAEIGKILDPQSKRPRARGQEILEAAHAQQNLITRTK